VRACVYACACVYCIFVTQLLFGGDGSLVNALKEQGKLDEAAEWMEKHVPLTQQNALRYWILISSFANAGLSFVYPFCVIRGALSIFILIVCFFLHC
jgi:hypothetical protein